MMFTTSLTAAAVASFLAAGTLSPSSDWAPSYATARTLAHAHNKPIAVFLTPGNLAKLTNGESLPSETSKLISEKYIAVQIDTTTEDLRIRIGQLGPVVDQDGFLLTFPGNPDAVPVLPDSLSAEAQATVDGHRRWRVRIPPTIFSRSGLPWQIRAATASGSDCPTAPWWLRSAWRTVVAPKDTGG